MRVLLAAPGLPPEGRWGTEVYSDHLARGLRDLGHEVSVFVPDSEPGEPLLEEFDRVGLRILRARTPRPRGRSLVHGYRNPHQEALFREALGRVRPEVVHVLQLSWRLSLRLPALARAFGVRTVATLTDLGIACHRGHGLDASLRSCGLPKDSEVCAKCIRHGSRPAEFGRTAGGRARGALDQGGAALRRGALDLWARVGGGGGVVRASDIEARRAEVRTALAALDAWVLPTRALGEELLRAGLGRDRAFVLPYSFDTSPYVRARELPGSERRRLGYFGQLAPHKGVGVLVRAAGLLGERSDLPPWELRIHGAAAPGRWRDYPRRLSREMNSDHVHLERPFSTGRSAGVLAGLDGLVVPSLWVENAPLSALEARAAGVPLVVSDVGGLTEVVREGIDGWHVPAGDATALADRLGALLASPRRRMPDPGLPIALGRHLEAMVSIYRGLPESEPGDPGADRIPGVLPAAVSESSTGSSRREPVFAGAGVGDTSITRSSARSLREGPGPNWTHPEPLEVGAGGHPTGPLSTRS